MAEVTAPAPVTCPHCGEPVLPGEPDPRLIYMQEYHSECAARGVLGSVGHILGQCSCHGGTWEDPPLMTRRQAARMSVHLTERGFLPPPPRRLRPD